MPTDARLAVLPPDAASAGVARRQVRAALTADCAHLLDSAELLVSELVSNAVLHARTEVQVEVQVRADAVRIAVSDGSLRAAVRRRHGLSAGTGRGLALVASLATDWGVVAAEAPWAKTVWFELPLDAQRLPEVVEGGLYGEDWLAVAADA